MPRGFLDILKKVLGMHAQVVTKPSLATSGQLTNMAGTETLVSLWHGLSLQVVLTCRDCRYGRTNPGILCTHFVQINYILSRPVVTAGMAGQLQVICTQFG